MQVVEVCVTLQSSRRKKPQGGAGIVLPYGLCYAGWGPLSSSVRDNVHTQRPRKRDGSERKKACMISQDHIHPAARAELFMEDVNLDISPESEPSFNDRDRVWMVVKM